MPTREELIKAVQAELAKRQNPDRITTREQALERAEEMDAGGLEAGPWYMEMAKDVMNPIDAIAGAATGGARAAGRGVAGLANIGSKPLVAAGERQSAINMIKNPAKLEPYARGLLDDAASKIGTRIDDKEAALRQLIKGRSGSINPDVVSEIMPQYGAKLAQRRGVETVSGSMGEPIVQQAAQGRVDVPLENLLRVKRVGDKMKKFSPTDTMNPNAVPRMQGASRASDLAREQIYQNAPGSQDVLGEMGKDIKLKNFLTKRAAKNPVSAIQTNPATLKDSVMAQVDEAAGTGLRKAGDRLQSAKGDLIEPGNLLRPLQLPAEATKIVKRGAIGAGSMLNNGVETLGKIPGARLAGDALGYGSAIGAVDDMKYTPEAQEAPASSPDRAALIEKVKAELLRRQAP